MNKLRCIFSIFACLSLPLFGEILEVFHFDEIKKYVAPETLVILDIDDTLLVPTQMLGCDPWFIHRLNMYQSQGDYVFALDKALAEWEAVRHLTKVKIVEEGTAAIVSGLQEQNVVLMGLTTQGLALATRTVSQLHSLGLDLSKTAPSEEDQYFINGHGVLYRKGILFSAGSWKGKALAKFLDLIAFHPKRIVFINDKLSHLQDVEEVIVGEGIEYIGLRYAFSDERVKNFNQEIAEIQWKYSSFDRILSDEEAAEILKKNTQ